MQRSQRHVGIVGGGVIGLSVGWQLARAGMAVTVFERAEAGRGASRIAAGMLAPVAEAGFEELDLTQLARHSLALYPRFLAELSEDAGFAPRLDPCGTLYAGLDRDDTEHLRRLYHFRLEVGLRAEMMTGTAARARQPLLSPRVVSALWLPDDAQVDNRALVDALRRAFLQRGGTMHEHTPVRAAVITGGRVAHVVTEAQRHDVDVVVVAAGSYLGSIEGLPAASLPSIRPVKGQILTLRRTEACALTGIVRTPRVYLVAKEDGTLRVGATSEDQGYDTAPTAGGVKELLDEAWDVVPAIYDLPLEETVAGLRPASADHAPVVGAATDAEGLFYATGHFRHGILLAPATAFGLADEIVSGNVEPLLQPFRPDRFAGRDAPTGSER